MSVFRFFILLGSLCFSLVTLSACGSLPQPFRHAEGEAVLMPDLAGGVIVRPVTGPMADPYGLTDALVSVLNVAEVPAVLREAPKAEADAGGLSQPPTFADKTVIIEGKAVDEQTIVWQVSNAGGEVLGEYRQSVDKTALSRTSPEALRGIAQRAFPGIIALLPIEKSHNVAGPARIRLIPVQEAPGDGSVRLTSAMRLALKTAGFILTDEQPSYILTGNVLVAPYQAGAEMVSVTWLLTYPDGMELARIQQANPVPQGTMDGPWGNLANLIAEGGVQGVQEALRQKISKEGGQK